MNNGYTRIPNELIRNHNLAPIAKVVWSLIAGMSPRFNATLSQYCTMVACHPDTWRATVKMLERYGMVTVEHSPNGVKYSAITDPSKWTIPVKEGMKNSYPMKNSQGMKNSHPKGMKISEGEGMKISHPSEDYIEEQKNNNTTITHARTHEKLVAELLTDARIELAMMQHHISVEQYRQLVNEIIADWQFRDLPESDYNLNHFSSVLRYKVAAINRNNGNQRTTNDNNAADTSPDAFARYFAAKELERRSTKGTGIVP
jgi:hypothetical protein